MAHLVLARHGESQFNAKSLWTGTWDVPLTKKGREEAAAVAHAIKDLEPDVAFTSALSRATETLSIILASNAWKPRHVYGNAALNERDYGDLTGMNKWAVEDRYGRDQFQSWRRGWDVPVPDGETLKDVYERVIPYYEEHILPELAHGHDVLIVSHGNSLRALQKYLDKLSDQQIEKLSMPFGQAIIYNVDSHGKASGKKVKKVYTKPAPA